MTARYAESDGKTQRIWTIERIWQLAEALEAFELEIEEIVGLDAVTWFSPDGDQPTIRSMVKHTRRILDADLSYPPILTQDNRVFDGMHRIARHLLAGHTTITVKKFPQNPEPDWVEKL